MKKLATISGILLLGIGLGTMATIVFYKTHEQEPVRVIPQNKQQTSNTAFNEDTKLPAIRTSQKQAIQSFKRLYSSAKITSISLKMEHNHYVYDLSGFDQVKDCSIQVDATTGKIIGQTTLRHEYTDEEIEALNLKKTISRELASRVAIKAVGRGKAVAWNLSNKTKYDFPIWEVDVVNANNSHQISINALNGELID